MHTTVHHRTCEEEIIERRNLLQSRVSGLVAGLQPTELTTFLQALHDSQSVPLAVKQQIDAMSISSSSLIAKLTPSTHDSGSGSGDSESAAVAAADCQHDEFSPRDPNKKKKKVNKKHIAIGTSSPSSSSSSSSSSGTTGTGASINSKKKKSSKSYKPNDSTHITADTSSLNTRAEAILQTELEQRRASRINVICAIEQVTVDFTNRRGVIMKESFRVGRSSLM